MTTFSSQRQSPDVAQVEQRLLDIFNILGRSRIPELEFGDFCNDLERIPGSGKSLETWEEQIGVRLGLRILDQVIFEHFAKQEELGQTLTELTTEKQTVERENKRLREEMETLRQTSETRVGTLQQENRRLKGNLAKLMKKCEALTAEVIKDPSSPSRPSSSSSKPSSSRPSSVSLPVPTTKASSSSKSPSEVSSSSKSRPIGSEYPGQSEAGSRKRKTPSPQPPGVTEKEDNTGLGLTPKMSRSNSRVFSRRLSPNSALLVSSTQLHTHDPSFVPDTLQITHRLPTPRSSSSHQYDQDDMEITVPDTPEKSQDDPCPPSANIEPCVTPERPELDADHGPVSPLIQRSVRLKSSRKLALGHRKEVLRESNFKEDTRDVKTKKLARRKKEAENSAPMSLAMIDGDEIIPVSGNNPKKVERITPSAQSEIDKKSYRALDQDFATAELSSRLVSAERTEERTPEKKRRIGDKVRYFPSDTDSDFESPNLLAARSRKLLRPKVAPNVKENTEKKPERKVKEAAVKVEEEIDIFASPSFEENLVPKPVVKTRSIKALNRWGIDKQSFDSLSDSEKRKFSNNKQSKIDVFFKIPPQPSTKDAVRVSHADMDMERALKLSRDAAKVKEEAKKTSPEMIRNRVEDDDEIKIVDGVGRPKFAHVGPAVRGKEERKKLYGFDCRECQEYYHQKLEEGLTKDQILMLMNKCSKHRGLFKPPLTPERFWDADILEEDPDDPRVKTQPAQPLRTRAVRRAEAKTKKKALEME